MWCQISILVTVAVYCVLGFNLSPVANQVYQMPENQKTFMEKVRSSYFGFAINLRTDGIMISAPRAQTTLEMQRKLNETGAIYKCSFGDNTTCSPFVFDKLGDVQADRSESMYVSKKKEYQMLGMSMDGKGAPSDKFVVCAPKMITPTANREGDVWLIHGMCYVITNGTSGNRPSENAVEVAPLRATNLQVTVDEKLFYMYGEMGLSVHVTDNDEEILFGAPGVYQWKGTVVRYRPRRYAGDGGLSKRDNDRRRGRNTAHAQKIAYESDVPQPQRWNQTDDGYLGFAVGSGYFEGPTGRLLYCASAPRAGDNGEVYVFDYVNDPNSIGMVDIKKLAVFSGQQTGEYFGYTILAEDFNNDGFTDLVIGAPSHSADGYHEQGRVYYYQNMGGHFAPEPKAVLTGTDNGETDSRFGMSFGRIGDLDNDGFKDLAVGAPFEGQGAVYIFSGGPDGLRSTPVQKISNAVPEGETAPAEQSMFGLSISRGVDIDGNVYNGRKWKWK